MQRFILSIVRYISARKTYAERWYFLELIRFVW